MSFDYFEKSNPADLKEWRFATVEVIAEDNIAGSENTSRRRNPEHLMLYVVASMQYVHNASA